MSQKASGYEKIPGDSYFTPGWVGEALISAVCFDGLIWEPAAGAGDLADPFAKAGYVVAMSDIDPDRNGFAVAKADFFTSLLPKHIHGRLNVITNPPYGDRGALAVRFIEHALEVTKPSQGAVAMLLRVDFDSAKGRRRIFKDHPAFTGKIILTRRIRWVNLEQKKAGPTENHAWFYWDWRKQELPGVKPWLDYQP